MDNLYICNHTNSVPTFRTTLIKTQQQNLVILLCKDLAVLWSRGWFSYFPKVRMNTLICPKIYLHRQYEFCLNLYVYWCIMPLSRILSWFSFVQSEIPWQMQSCRGRLIAWLGYSRSSLLCLEWAGHNHRFEIWSLFLCFENFFYWFSRIFNLPTWIYLMISYLVLFVSFPTLRLCPLNVDDVLGYFNRSHLNLILNKKNLGIQKRTNIST